MALIWTDKQNGENIEAAHVNDLAAAIIANETAIGTKQATLTFDTTPTTGSTNPVTSDGAKTALDTKQNKIEADATAFADNIIVADGNSTNIKRTGYRFATGLAGDPLGVPTDEAVQNFTFNYTYSKNESETRLDTKEDVANKTQSVSDTSTETQYPSAKAVNDAIKSKVGGIYRPKGSCNSLQFQQAIMPLAHTVGDVYSVEDSCTINIEVDLSDKELLGTYKGTAFYFTDETYNALDDFRPGEAVTFYNSNPEYPNPVSAVITFVDNYYLYLNNAEIADTSMQLNKKAYTLNINAGDNVVWTTAGWDKLGANVDLSNYYTKTATDNAVQTYTYSKAQTDAKLGLKEQSLRLLNKKVVTSNETLQAIEFSAPDLGTIYSGMTYTELALRKIMVVTYAAKGTAASTSINVKNVGGTTFYTISAGSKITADKAWFIFALADYAHQNMFLSDYTESGYATTLKWVSHIRHSGVMGLESNYGRRPVEAVQWIIDTTGVTFPTGSYIEVWGC